jgi:hypothetical protein
LAKCTSFVLTPVRRPSPTNCLTASEASSVRSKACAGTKAKYPCVSFSFSLQSYHRSADLLYWLLSVQSKVLESHWDLHPECLTNGASVLHCPQMHVHFAQSLHRSTRVDRLGMRRQRCQASTASGFASSVGDENSLMPPQCYWCDLRLNLMGVSSRCRGCTNKDRFKRARRHLSPAVCHSAPARPTPAATLSRVACDSPGR